MGLKYCYGLFQVISLLNEKIQNVAGIFDFKILSILFNRTVCELTKQNINEESKNKKTRIKSKDN